jgi:hypothetical protein
MAAMMNLLEDGSTTLRGAFQNQNVSIRTTGAVMMVK